MDSYSATLRRNAQWSMQSYHMHTQYELLLVVSGNVHMFVTDHCYEMKRGTLLLIAPSVIHRSLCNDNRSYQRFVVHVSESWLKRVSTAKSDLQSVLPRSEQTIQLSDEKTEQMIAFFSRCIDLPAGFGADLCADIALIELLIKIKSLSEQNTSQQIPSSYAFPQYITRLLHYIPSHLSQKLTLNDLSELVYISKPQLCRAFRGSTGFSIHEYILQSRISAACQMLKQQCEITEICFAVGFSSYANFVRTFKKYMGTTPRKYRQDMQNAENNGQKTESSV